MVKLLVFESFVLWVGVVHCNSTSVASSFMYLLPSSSEAVHTNECKRTSTMLGPARHHTPKQINDLFFLQISTKEYVQ